MCLALAFEYLDLIGDVQYGALNVGEATLQLADSYFPVVCACFGPGNATPGIGCWASLACQNSWGHTNSRVYFAR